MTSYEIDVYIRDADGEIARERHFVMEEVKAGEKIEVWVDDHLKYEDEAEDDEALCHSYINWLEHNCPPYEQFNPNPCPGYEKIGETK